MKTFAGTKYMVGLILLFPFALAWGITFTNVTTLANLDGYPYSRASAWFDYDRDGYQDLVVGSELGYNRLHRNNGDGTFTDVTQEAGIPFQPGIWGVNFADIDNDGYQEIYFSDRAPDTVSEGRNTLLLNTGHGDFIDISDTSGAGVPGGGIAACFAPFSKGYNIDLFVPNQYYPNVEFPFFLTNNGGITFTDRTEQVGLHLRDWWDVPIVFDFDNDSQLELFCTKDYHGNSMYEYVPGGQFTDISDSINIQTPCGYGATIGDINNDGYFDLYVTNWHDIYDNLFIFNGTYYDDETWAWHARGNTWTSAAHFADFNNDGWLDLLVMGAGTGNKYYENDAGTEYVDRTAQSGLSNYNYNWGMSIGDYDNDGFLDIFMPEYIHSSNGGRLYHNNGNDNNWFKVELEGRRSNRDGIGARIYVESDSFRQTRQVIAGSGFGSQNSLIQHFGLGQDSSIHYLSIQWPSGINDIYADLGVNQTLHAIEGEIVSVDDAPLQTPAEFHLGSFYPNPFNAGTRASLDVFKSSYLDIEITDILGRRVKKLHQGMIEPGQRALYWDGIDEDGIHSHSGIYFCTASDGETTESARIVLIK